MNLVDKLLKSDTKRAKDLETRMFRSKRLAHVLQAEDETVEVKLRALMPRRANDILTYQVDRNGDVDFSKTFDTELMLCIEGIVDPDMRNKDLQEHFGCKTAKDLCEVLFGPEVSKISDTIIDLSGIKSDGNKEEEIKN